MGNDLETCSKEIYSSKVRVVVKSIGKNAIIANKIVATLNSARTPSLFMHATDAIQGDLGMVLQEDNVISVCKSGNTPVSKLLVSRLKRMFSNPLGDALAMILLERRNFTRNFVQNFSKRGNCKALHTSN